jgi:uncharacterized damage-inducible protein DinB
MTTRVAGFKGEFLWELETVIRQSVAMADAIPTEKYAWRPDANVRSVSEVFVHVATGNYMLLDAIGIPAPMALYSQLPAVGPEHFWGLIQRNDELVDSVREKSEVIDLLKQSLNTVMQSFSETDDAELCRQVFFFGEMTTVRRAYLRLLAHTNEHMGQMIAYLRFNHIAIPWPDWRPDRQNVS